MPTPKLTPADIIFILVNYQTMTGSDFARKFNCDKGVIYRCLKFHGRTTPKELIKSVRSRVARSKTTSTPEIDAIIREKYLELPGKTLAAQIEKSHTFLMTRLRQLGLVIPREIIEKRKSESQFKTDHIPANKGKQMPADIYELCKPTMFKTGHLPHNTLYDGAITVRHDHPDRDGRKYKYIRLSLAQWKQLHVYMWEEKYGPVPEGHVVRFKTNNTISFTVDDLELITMAENMERNSIHRYPDALRLTIHAKAQLSRLISKLKNDE